MAGAGGAEGAAPAAHDAPELAASGLSKGSREGHRPLPRHPSFFEESANAIGRTMSVIKDDVETLMEPTKHTTPGKPIHTASIIFNLLQSVMGVGILSLAATYEFIGLGGGILLMFAGAAMSFFSIHLLLTGLLVSRQDSFEALGFYCFGSWGRVWVQLMLPGNSLIALICFLVPLKAFIFDFIREVLSEDAFSAFEDHGGSAELCLGAALVLVIIPITLMRKIDKLWFTSLLGSFFVIFFTCVSFGYMLNVGPLEQRNCTELAQNGDISVPTEDIVYFRTNLGDWFQTVSIIACSFCCQFTIFPVYREVSVGEGHIAAVKKVERSGGLAMLVACLIYIVAASSGYITWREVATSPSSILACYKPTQPLIVICYFGMSCVLMFAYPLVTFSMRYCLATVFFDEEKCKELSLFWHVVFTALVVVPTATVAFFVDKLTTVIAVGGAFTAPQLCYVIPGALYVRAKMLHDKLGDDSDDSDLEGGVEDGLGAQLAKRQKVAGASSAGGWVMLFAGITIQVLCIYGALRDIL